MIVVSNSSPLIALSRIGRLDILISFYKRILVPAEVHHEVTVARAWPSPEPVKYATPSGLPWYRKGRPRILYWRRLARASALASAAPSYWPFPADLVLLDESKARRSARAAGLAIIGCLGVLEAGARRGLVPDLRQAYIDLLRQGIRFDIGLLQDSLARLGLPKL